MKRCTSWILVLRISEPSRGWLQLYHRSLFPTCISRAHHRNYVQNNKEQVALKPEYLQKYGDTETSLDNPEKNGQKDFEENFEDSSVAERDASAPSPEAEPDDIMDVSKLNTQFSVTLPSRASYSNADNVADGTYYWNVTADKPVSIKLQFIVYNSFAITLLILGVFGLLFLLAKRILKHDTQKRIGTNN